MKIWYQSVTRSGRFPAYNDVLRRVIDRTKDPDTEVEIQGIERQGGTGDQYRYLAFMQTVEILENVHRAIFVSAREEGGINVVYDHKSDSECFQVFIHNRLPFEHVKSWEFRDFSSARSFAEQYFDADTWDLLLWNMKTNRPCEGGSGTSCTKSSCGGNGSSESTDGSGGCSDC